MLATWNRQCFVNKVNAIMIHCCRICIYTHSFFPLSVHWLLFTFLLTLPCAQFPWVLSQVPKGIFLNTTGWSFKDGKGEWRTVLHIAWTLVLGRRDYFWEVKNIFRHFGYCDGCSVCRIAPTGLSIKCTIFRVIRSWVRLLKNEWNSLAFQCGHRAETGTQTLWWNKRKGRLG